MRKKILSLALALTLCLGLTVPAFAAETKSVTFEKFGMVVTMYGYLRTELYKIEDNIIVTVYVVEDGSMMEFKAMDGYRYASDEEILRDTGKFFDYGAVLNGYAGYSFGNIWRPLTGPGTVAMDPNPPHSSAYGGFDIYNCIFICESDLAWVLDDADGAERIPDQSETPPAGITASPTNDKLEVNGAAADPTVYKIGGSNYFKIRDVAALLNGTEKQFAVGYDGEKNAVTATTGQGYEKQPGDLVGAPASGDQSAAASNDAIYVDGEKIAAEVYKIDGSNYFKLRDLGKALNFYVGWSAQRGMYIETDKPYAE